MSKSIIRWIGCFRAASETDMDSPMTDGLDTVDDVQCVVGYKPKT